MWGFAVVLTISLLGLFVLYLVVSLSFWGLCRMAAVTDRFVESRANVCPIKRG